MKKALTLILVAGMFSFYACGPGAEDKAASEKATQDSIDAAQQVMEEMEKVTQDSIDHTQEEMEKAKQDSMAK